MKKLVVLMIILLVLSGCSNVPEGFSKERYKDFAKIYQGYEKARLNNDPCEYLGKLYDYRKLEEKGKLTAKEAFVRDKLTELIIMYNASFHDLDDSTYDVTKLSPNRITIEIAGGDVRKVREKEEELRTYLQLKPLPINEKVEKKNKAAYKQAKKYISSISGLGEAAIHGEYKNSFITYRKEIGEYYIASWFSYKQKDYKYDMILDSKLNLVDAYLVDAVSGPFSDPMNKDRRPKLDEFSKEPINEGAEGGNSSQETEGTEYTEENSSHIQENEPEWDKEEYLFPTLQNISDLLTNVRQLNSDALSLSLNEDNANQTLQLLESNKINLGFMIEDSTTKKHLNLNEINTIKQIISNLDEVISTERAMISNPSTQNIRLAETVVEDAQVTIDAVLITGNL